MICEKPVTKQIMQRANRLFKEYMNYPPRHILTKEEIAIIIGVKNERSARDVISALAKKVPIIATSDAKGYWMARTTEDIEFVKHVWMEIDSRIEELEARKKPLIAFYEKAKEVRNG